MSEDVVLDASAVLCLPKEEAGTPRVEAALPRASISAVNLAEVVTKLAEAGGSAAHIAAILDVLDPPVVEFDERQAVTCGSPPRLQGCRSATAHALPWHFSDPLRL